MKKGDKVLISPDLTKLPNWISGIVIEVENNPFVGIVISAETEDKNVFFGQDTRKYIPYTKRRFRQSVQSH